MKVLKIFGESFKLLLHNYYNKNIFKVTIERPKLNEYRFS